MSPPRSAHYTVHALALFIIGKLWKQPKCPWTEGEQTWCTVVVKSNRGQELLKLQTTAWIFQDEWALWLTKLSTKRTCCLFQSQGKIRFLKTCKTHLSTIEFIPLGMLKGCIQESLLEWWNLFNILICWWVPGLAHMQKCISCTLKVVTFLYCDFIKKDNWGLRGFSWDHLQMPEHITVSKSVLQNWIVERYLNTFQIRFYYFM